MLLNWAKHDANLPDRATSGLFAAGVARCVFPRLGSGLAQSRRVLRIAGRVCGIRRSCGVVLDICNAYWPNHWRRRRASCRIRWLIFDGHASADLDNLLFRMRRSSAAARRGCEWRKLRNAAALAAFTARQQSRGSRESYSRSRDFRRDPLRFGGFFLPAKGELEVPANDSLSGQLFSSNRTREQTSLRTAALHLFSTTASL